MSVTLEKALAKLAENLQEILKVSEKKKKVPFFLPLSAKKSNPMLASHIYSTLK